MADHFNEFLDGKRSTTDGAFPHSFEPGAPGPIDSATGQHTQYWVLSESERAKGFVRPLRRSYVHDACGTHTTMGLALCETYARDPKFYGATFCAGCRSHLPVHEFRWFEDGQRVGS
jgi:hypothetical protein